MKVYRFSQLLTSIALVLTTANCEEVFSNFGDESNRKKISPAAYLQEVFHLLKTHSIKRDSIDFRSLETDAFAAAEKASSTKDCYPIIRRILKELGDNHSFLMEPERVKNWETTSNSWKERELYPFVGKMLASRTAYLFVPGFRSNDARSVQAFADSLQQLIRKLNDDRPKGWIVDFRSNTGGNCWPMLAGLSPLLDEDTLGYFLDVNKKKNAWFYNGKGVGVNREERLSINGNARRLIREKEPVAVLTGPKTASSGELLAISFKGNARTQSFGQATRGLSTGNTTHRLPDGAMLAITSSIYMDRFGNIYGGKIRPDVPVAGLQFKGSTGTDPVVIAAENWILNFEK